MSVAYGPLPVRKVEDRRRMLLWRAADIGSLISLSQRLTRHSERRRAIIKRALDTTTAPDNSRLLRREDI